MGGAITIWVSSPGRWSPKITARARARASRVPSGANTTEGEGSGLSGTFWGEYNDEGSAYITETKNVYANFGAYVTANSNASNNTGHITFTNNWGSSASPGLNGPGSTVSGNIQINGDTFPADAQTIVNAAGLEAAYADLKTNP